MARALLNAIVVVAALGYFVDVYDLILFSVVRVASLRDLGVPDAQLMSTGVLLLNAQMAGMLLGGIAWGVWGDKRGRLSVLFGSILLYSVANLANGFVHNVPLYVILRFLAGLGLAGELGAGITLVSEALPKDRRGYGTTLVATVGVMGALVAATVCDLTSWRHSYFIGGGLGLLLLILRVSVRESALFVASRSQDLQRGDLRLLFNQASRGWRYVQCILTGLPIWFVLGILITFSPEFAREFGVVGEVRASQSVFYVYVGFVVGDLASGLLSQFLRSRKKAIALFVALVALSMLAFLTLLHGATPAAFYAVCVPMGIGSGYWAVLVTTSSEQFGTNLRSTVTTSVPNLVRGAVLPMTFAFESLKSPLGLAGAAELVGGICVLLSVVSLARLRETFHRDLDFVEERA